MWLGLRCIEGDMYPGLEGCESASDKVGPCRRPCGVLGADLGPTLAKLPEDLQKKNPKTKIIYRKINHNKIDLIRKKNRVKVFT